MSVSWRRSWHGRLSTPGLVNIPDALSNYADGYVTDCGHGLCSAERFCLARVSAETNGNVVSNNVACHRPPRLQQQQQLAIDFHSGFYHFILLPAVRTLTHRNHFSRFDTTTIFSERSSRTIISISLTRYFFHLRTSTNLRCPWNSTEIKTHCIDCFNIKIARWQLLQHSSLQRWVLSVAAPSGEW